MTLTTPTRSTSSSGPRPDPSPGRARRRLPAFATLGTTFRLPRGPGANPRRDPPRGGPRPARPGLSRPCHGLSRTPRPDLTGSRASRSSSRTRPPDRSRAASHHLHIILTYAPRTPPMSRPSTGRPTARPGSPARCATSSSPVQDGPQPRAPGSCPSLPLPGRAPVPRTERTIPCAPPERACRRAGRKAPSFTPFPSGRPKIKADHFRPVFTTLTGTRVRLRRILGGPPETSFRNVSEPMVRELRPSVEARSVMNSTPGPFGLDSVCHFRCPGPCHATR